jgi:hypothetical protein
MRTHLHRAEQAAAAVPPCALLRSLLLLCSSRVQAGRGARQSRNTTAYIF